MSNGAVRDTERLSGVDLGIMALATSPVRSGKTGIGAIDVPVVFGNALINPGDHIYCDRDGILVSEDPLTLPQLRQATARMDHQMGGNHENNDLRSAGSGCHAGGDSRSGR